MPTRSETEPSRQVEKDELEQALHSWICLEESGREGNENDGARFLVRVTPTLGDETVWDMGVRMGLRIAGYGFETRSERIAGGIEIQAAGPGGD